MSAADRVMTLESWEGEVVRDWESDAADVLGIGGIYRDPLWRVTVALTALERELLRCWWVRRLAYVAHAGAAAITTVQTYSRLEHSLGVLALVAHFDPDNSRPTGDRLGVRGIAGARQGWSTPSRQDCRSGHPGEFMVVRSLPFRRNSLAAYRPTCQVP